MSFVDFLFYAFSAVLLFAAFRVITARNPVHAVLFLVLAFFVSAGLWLLLEAEFLGIALVLVYVGAVMVLFLFVVMMLDVNTAVLRSGFTRYLPLGAAIALVLIAEMGLLIWRQYGGDAGFEPLVLAEDFSNTTMLGTAMYTDYLFPFEIAAVILLVAIIAAISLTMRRRPNTKYQDPAKQIGVRRDDRVRLVRMASEKRE